MIVNDELCMVPVSTSQTRRHRGSSLCQVEACASAMQALEARKLMAMLCQALFDIEFWLDFVEVCGA